MPKTEKRQIGDWGENKAACFLGEQGYGIIHRNYQTKLGEIDIIAWHVKPHHGNTLCFVEVKTRSDDNGAAERATGEEKLKHLLRAARQYCMEQAIDIERTPIQFEQVSIYGRADQGRPAVRHYVIPVD